MIDKEQLVIDVLCDRTETSWMFCDISCYGCNFYHEDSDMGARVPICIRGFGKSKDSCGCYMTRHEYLELVKSVFRNIKNENANLRELVSDMCELLVSANWPTVEYDEQASKCIHRAEEI